MTGGLILLVISHEASRFAASKCAVNFRFALSTVMNVAAPPPGTVQTIEAVGSQVGSNVSVRVTVLPPADASGTLMSCD